MGQGRELKAKGQHAGKRKQNQGTTANNAKRSCRGPQKVLFLGHSKLGDASRASRWFLCFSRYLVGNGATDGEARKEKEEKAAGKFRGFRVELEVGAGELESLLPHLGKQLEVLADFTCKEVGSVGVSELKGKTKNTFWEKPRFFSTRTRTVVFS